MARKSRKNISAEESIAAVTYPSWVYARISHDSDHAEDSIENQIAICKGYINGSNEMTFCGEFTDLGFSGTNFERPGYSEMMAGILKGDIKCVVVKDLSRLGRTYIEVGELLFDTFVQHGIRFISVNDQYDSFSDDAGRKKLLILFKNLVNHMYSRDLGKKIKSAHTAKKQRGEPAGQPPYGYRFSEGAKKLVIDEDAASIVKMIFDMRLRDESIHSITRELNRKKIPSPQQRRYQLGEIKHENFSGRIIWQETYISRLLNNETYTGSLIQGKYQCDGKKSKLLPKEKWIVHENAHEAIISKEQFEAVSQLVSKSAEQYKHKHEITTEENRYAGKVTCSRCGKMAFRTANYRKERINYYYSCPHCLDELKYEHGLKKASKLPLIKLDRAVMGVLGKYTDILIQFDNLPDILSKSDPLRKKRASVEKERTKLEKAINDSDKSLSKAYQHHLEGLLDMREYELIRTKIENDKQQSEAILTKICAEQRRYDIDNTLGNQWLVKYREFRDYDIPTKELVNTLIRRISITPLTNDLDIELNFEDCYEDLKLIMEESGVTVNV